MFRTLVWLTFPQDTRYSTDAYHFWRQKLRCRRTARVEQFAGYFAADDHLRTI